MPAFAELLADPSGLESEEDSIQQSRPNGHCTVQALAPKTRRACAVAGAVAGVTLVATLAFTTLPPRSALSVGSAAAFEEKLAVMSVREYKKWKAPFPKPYECSLATPATNCAQSQCCENFGFQCYAKNATLALCMEACDPAELDRKGNGSWSCKPLGLRNRCAFRTEDCSMFGCCADENHQCYEQSKGKASCRKSCDPYVNKTQNWTCQAIGPRNTHMYEAGAYAPGSMEIAPPLEQCSQIGKSCAATKCCRESGYNCYEKNASWASCLMNCIPGKSNGGISNFPEIQAGAPEDSPPAHWFPVFEEPGPGAWSCKRLAPPLVTGRKRGTSLFCFTVALSDNGAKKKHPELDLVRTAQSMKTGVFACDIWNVFSDLLVQLDPGQTIKVDYTKVHYSNGTAVRRPNTQIYVNTLLFVNVWGYIKHQTTWKSFSWVVKADPFTVFIPSRLRSILSHQMVTPSGVYMENCKYVRMSLHGSLEVVSKDAFGTFLDNLEECQSSLPWRNAERAHFRYYGEDKFLQHCMDRHGVSRVPSRQMVDTVPKSEPRLYGLHLSVSCPGHRTKFERALQKWKPNCSRSVTAGMHAFKTPKAYIECLRNTTKLWPGAS